jgi:hypothetical protein
VKSLSASSLLSWRGNWFRGRQAIDPPSEPDGLEAFAAERDSDAPVRSARPAARAGHRWTIAALAAVALVEAPFAGLWLYEQAQPYSAVRASPPASPDIQRAIPPVVTPAVAEPVAPAPPAAASVANNAAPSATVIHEPERASPPVGAGGWVSMRTPVPMQVLEDGRLIGTTEVERLMLPVGTHRLEIVSDALGYRAQQDVTIRPGQTSILRLEMPTGTLALNALPWAEVWVDGERVGETPIGNLTRTIGPHEIVFRHPELGERKTTIVVTLKAPARVGVDLRSKP